MASIIFLTGGINRVEKRLLDYNGILPLYFHNPKKEVFLRLIKWFVKHKYVFVSLNNIIEELGKNNRTKKLWISFDDGWKENYTEILPILKYYSIPATFFISINCVEEGFFWFSAVRNHQDKLNYSVKEFWEVPNKERIIRVQQLFERNKISVETETITIEQLKELASSSIATIGNHSYSHAILTNCDKNDLDYEIVESNKIIENYIGRKVNSFAYPDGRYNSTVIKYLKKRKFEYAFTTKPGIITEKSDKYTLNRNSVPDRLSSLENLCHAFGIWQLPIVRLKKLFKKELKKY